MSNKLALIVAVAITAIILISSQVDEQHANDSKVQVDFYTESLCPDCLQFMRGSLKTAANTPDFWKICNFNIYPYGNAKRSQNGSHWAFTCQHGTKECQGNLIEACVTRKYDYYSKGLPFVLCLDENTTDFSAQGQRCASRLGLNWNEIDTCAKGSEGNKLMYDIAVATENLNPKHTYVPWLVVNGQHSRASESAIIKNMVQYVCSIYTGPEKIAACKR